LRQKKWVELLTELFGREIEDQNTGPFRFTLHARRAPTTGNNEFHSEQSHGGQPDDLSGFSPKKIKCENGLKSE
jgi:hypothetical protein